MFVALPCDMGRRVPAEASTPVAYGTSTAVYGAEMLCVGKSFTVGP